MQIETTKSTLTLYFDTPVKLQKWKDALTSILEINSKISKRRVSKARSQDRTSSQDNLFKGDQDSHVNGPQSISGKESVSNEIPKY